MKYLDSVLAELSIAQKNYPAFHSEHEGFAVLKEEVDELWEAIRLKQSDTKRMDLIEHECIQVAAMALRLLYDRCSQGIEINKK